MVAQGFEHPVNEGNTLSTLAGKFHDCRSRLTTTLGALQQATTEVDGQLGHYQQHSGHLAPQRPVSSSQGSRHTHSPQGKDQVHGCAENIDEEGHVHVPREP
jgi:hypothetical protein